MHQVTDENGVSWAFDGRRWLYLASDSQWYVWRRPCPPVTLRRIVHRNSATPWKRGQLMFSDQGVSFTTNGREPQMTVPIDHVVAVEVSERSEAKSRIPQTLGLSLVGLGLVGLASRSSSEETELLVHLSTGAAAYFTFDGYTAAGTRAMLGQWLHAKQISSTAAAPSVGSPL